MVVQLLQVQLINIEIKMKFAFFKFCSILLNLADPLHSLNIFSKLPDIYKVYSQLHRTFNEIVHALTLKKCKLQALRDRLFTAIIPFILNDDGKNQNFSQFQGLLRNMTGLAACTLANDCGELNTQCWRQIPVLRRIPLAGGAAGQSHAR